MYNKEGAMLTKKKITLVAVLFSCGLLVGELFAQSSAKSLPEKNSAMAIPNDPYVIDAEIKRLKALKQGLVGQAYISDEDAMRFEFEDWEDYQDELKNEERLKRRIARVQQKIDMLEAQMAKL